MGKITLRPLSQVIPENKPGDGSLRPVNFPVKEVNDSHPVSVYEFLLNQAGKEGCDLFGIFDSARNVDFIKNLVPGDVKYRSLFQGTMFEQSSVLSGYLVECKKESPLFRWMTTKAWSKGCCIYLTSMSSFDELFSHFQKFNRVRMENDKVVLFRYYDPEVLRAWLPGCSRIELDTFYGETVATLFTENEDSDFINVYNRSTARTDPGFLLISKCRIVRSDPDDPKSTDGGNVVKTLRLH